MAQLFKKNILNEKLKDFKIPDFEKKIEILESWNNLYKSGKLQEKKETSIQGEFASHILGGVLGYSDFVENNSEWNRQNEPGNPTGGQSADFGLGYFKSSKDFSQNIVKVVVEVKDTNISLDKPQQRAGNLTPIQQAFKYKPYFKECDFIIVSNFYETRLYIDSYYDYESFTLNDLVDSKNNHFNFRKFYFLLCKENLITKKGESNTKGLLSYTRTKEKEITKQFYKDYTNLRKELFKDIVANNPGFKKTELDFLLNKTQKVIDRIIFIHFCEDLGLLPSGKLKENLLRAEEIGFSPWEMLKKFFEFVNSGSEKLGIPEGYNGGLFKEDKDLNNLKVGDEICKKFIDLGDYNFSDDLSVNILGHIFEQSISDIEELKDKINKQEEAVLSKRKKDGVFYTPEYIVDYIVKNSVGKKIDEWEEELKEKHSLKEDINDKNYIKRAILVYSDLQEKVKNIKVLDPACGSGAFLVKVFDFLLDKNKEISKKLEDLGVSQGLFSSESYFKSILQNNIYGVDLNEESVEITKLSLWLKTALKGKKLANLDSNIKCGNSLIDDKEIAGDKAFVWEEEFSQIFNTTTPSSNYMEKNFGIANTKTGYDEEMFGFDVIVGNPPYGAKLDKESFDWFNKNYETSEYKIDTYTLFIEKSIKLLKKNGKLSFIIPYTFINGKYFSKIRKYINTNSKINNIIILGKSIFSDADVDTLILEVSKSENNHKFNWLDLRNFENKEEKLSSGYFEEGELSKNYEKEIILADKNTGNIISKIEKNLKLKEIVNFYHGLQTRGDEGAIFEAKLGENYFQILKGGDFHKYSFSIKEKYILFSKENIKSGGDKEKYLQDKLIMRTTGDSFITTFDNKNYICLNSVNLILQKDERFNLKYVLSLLNSKLINFWYQTIIQEKGKTFAEVKITYLEKIPIPNIMLSEQKPFIEKADFMLESNKILQEKITKFLNRLKSSFELEKISTKLEKFYELDFSDFVKELAKNKIKLSLKDQDEWEEYFSDYKKEILELKSQINKCDKEIDDMVFDLYGLDEEERKVVLCGN